MLSPFINREVVRDKHGLTPETAIVLPKQVRHSLFCHAGGS